MKICWYILFLFALYISVSGQVKTGLEILIETDFQILKGKRVGLITNPTGVDSKLKTTIEIFAERNDFFFKAIFGPEHGARGEYAAGDYVQNYTDKVTGLPVYSLYGKTRKPTKEMLDSLDVLVYDIQDIGCRSYTYISTMGLCMEAAAEYGKEFVVLDRPNPLGGLKIEGPIVQPDYVSFVSQFPVPYIYAMTCGELAQYLNEEGLLKDGIRCKLSVVKMEGWKRDMSFDKTGLPWVMTSPHIPSMYHPPFYVATGVLGELGVISEGVGYTLPFQIFAAEWIEEDKLAAKMNSLGLEGVYFRPLTIKPYYGKYKDKVLKGVQIYFTDYSKVHLMALQFRFLEIHAELYPDKNPFELCDKSRISMFDKVCGTSELRETFTKNMKFADIENILKRDVESFREKNKKYYLY